MLQMGCSPFIVHLVLFHNTCLLLCCLIRRLRLDMFCLCSSRLGHSQVCSFALLRLLLFGCAPGLAGATLVDGGCSFHRDGCFHLGQTGVLSDVDGEVGVERLQLSGEELIGQRVEAVRAPVESGSFQKVKSRKTDMRSQVCVFVPSNLLSCQELGEGLIPHSCLCAKCEVTARKLLA